LENWTQKLVDGYQAFRRGDYKSQKNLYETLGKEGQAPKIMLIACADSRVDPTDIFNAYPGEMFVTRNVANIVPPLDETEGYHGTSAAIEYAVKALKVEMIVILGHESCGGVQGCIDGAGEAPHADYVGKWVSLINGVRDDILLEVVRESIRNLMTFDFVKDAVEAGTLKLQGAYFSIIKARLMMLNDDDEFEVVSDRSRSLAN